MTRFDPAFQPRSTTLKGVLVNNVSAPALLSHGIEVVTEFRETGVFSDAVMVNGAGDSVGSVDLKTV